MPNSILENQISSWLKSQAYWFQYAGSKLLQGIEVSPELLAETYSLFKEDSGLKEKAKDRVAIVFKEALELNTQGLAPLELLAIKDVANVNALASTQEITISPGLTIVYGGNGTGKSGYVRLLNNAFNSRGDKTMLPNTAGSTGTPSASFTFKGSGALYSLKYPEDANKPEFKKYFVFDSQSARIHLENDNKLNFTPRGFEFFENVVELFDGLRALLNTDIQKNTPPNDFTQHFTNQNEVFDQVSTLSEASDIKTLGKLWTITDADEKEIVELTIRKNELTSTGILHKITLLQKHVHPLNELKKKIETINLLLPENLAFYSDAILNINKLAELSRQEGISSLSKYSIESLGSNEWKAFIKASKNYAEAIDRSRQPHTYPHENDNCLFCLRPLKAPENEIIQAYWKLLKSEAEAEFARKTKEIAELSKKLKALGNLKFDETMQAFEFIHSKYPEKADAWKGIIQKIEASRLNIIKKISEQNGELEIIENRVPLEEIDSFLTSLNNEIEELAKQDPSKELEEIEKKLALTKDRKTLKIFSIQILKFIEHHKWARKATNAVSSLKTNSLTAKQGELFTEHVSDTYIQKFNSECVSLDAPRFVTVIQKNAKISSLRNLRVAGQIASKILSEGEQRAVSLADFITELQLNPHSRGVIFDDPVTSLDHQRREKIAERFVKLAQSLQVVIFTHDISFFLSLKTWAENIKLNHSITTIRNIGGVPGIIKPDLPWVAQPVSKRIGVLRDRLVRVKKIEKGGDSEEYLFEAKLWYGLLREAWERAVEERLFKGVVERFNPGIQTQKLRKIDITPKMLADIEKGMTDCSKWVHDAAAGLNPTPPDTVKAEADLQFLDDFQKVCVTA